MKKYLMLFVLCVLCVSAAEAKLKKFTALQPPQKTVAYVTPTFDEFTFRLPITARAAAPFYTLSVPAIVYQNARSTTLSDVAVFNAGKELVPYVVSENTQRTVDTTEEQVSVPFFPLSFATADDSADVLLNVNKDERGTIISVGTSINVKSQTVTQVGSYLLDLTTLTGTLDSFVINWKHKTQNETNKILISFSQDLLSWSSSHFGVLAHLEKDGETVVVNRIDLPANSLPEGAKYARVTWEEGTAPIEITGITAGLSHHTTEQVVDEAFVVDGKLNREPASVHGGGQARDYVVYDTKGQFPVTALNLQFADHNRTLKSAVYGSYSGSAESWSYLGTQDFYSLFENGQEFIAQPLSVNVRYRYYKVVPIGQGTLPQPLPRLSVTWRPQEIVFLAQGSGPYSLNFGCENAVDQQTRLGLAYEKYLQDKNEPTVVTVNPAELILIDQKPVVVVEAPKQNIRTIIFALLSVVVIGTLVVMGVRSLGASPRKAEPRGKQQSDKKVPPTSK
ncbi:MAG: hypothetical protein ACD_62C00595G0002 [uncultured bacterium]|nr:MAG: hypothetical protein ACD_62C00595G0002 [uncultured bacterium]